MFGQCSEQQNGSTFETTNLGVQTALMTKDRNRASKATIEPTYSLHKQNCFP